MHDCAMSIRITLSTFEDCKTFSGYMIWRATPETPLMFFQEVLAFYQRPFLKALHFKRGM